MGTDSESKMSPALKWVLIGCGGVCLVAVICVVGLLVWILSSPEGGVKLANEMDDYALEYLDEHRILEPEEELVAYYDVTIAMNGSEAVILTNERVIYHKDGRTTAIALSEVEDISHRYESLIGDVIEIQSRTGAALKVEIAPLNQGETFKRVLMATWKRAQPTGELAVENEGAGEAVGY